MEGCWNEERINSQKRTRLAARKNEHRITSTGKSKTMEGHRNDGCIVIVIVVYILNWNLIFLI